VIQLGTWIPIALAALVVSACIVGLVIWREGGKHRYFPRRFGVVGEGFYRSGQLHPRLVERVLREQRIDLVIDLAAGDPPDGAAERAERAAVERLGIERREFHMYGNGRAPLAVHVGVLQAISAGRREGKRVLVHCNAGRERTGAIIAFYRILFEGWDGGRAHAEYLHYRNRPEGRRILVKTVNARLREVGEALIHSGDLAAIPDPMPVFREEEEA
jgi:protein tyrosine/serine phosphatase